MADMKHYKYVLTGQFFEKYFVGEEMSFGEIADMLTREGIPIDRSTVGRYAEPLGFERSLSECRRLRDDCVIDYDKSFMNDTIKEWIDGLLLGDGGLSWSGSSNTKMARLQCGQEFEECAAYFMSGLGNYAPIVRPVKSDSMNSGFVYQGVTKHHPDLHAQWLRWYPEVEGKRVKQPPEDVIISPASVMLWYLGDGSTNPTGDNSIHLRLSTDGFAHERVEFLVDRLKTVGIQSHRNGDNRVYVKAKGIPAFFDFVGRKSPISCYDKKFALPEWRFEAKRMREVADELQIDYQKLAYWTKIGRVPCFRASTKGKPRFLPDHIAKVKEAFLNAG